MSLRALGSLLTRRFFPRGTPRAQADSSPRVMSQAAVVSAFAGLVGILFFKKHADGSAGDVTDEEAKKEMAGKCKKPVSINEVTDKNASQQEVTDRVTMEKQDMEAMFEDWMKKHGRAYKDEEEKAMRFEIFKESVKQIESYLGKSRSRLPNNLADYTKEEVLKLIGSCYTEEELRKEQEELLLREKQLMKKKAMMESATVHDQRSDPAGNC